MKVVNERSSLAAYDVGVRAQAQLRDTAALRRERVPLAQGGAPRQAGKLAELSLQLNRQSSALQSAHFYLSEVAEHMTGLKRDVGRSLAAPSKQVAPDLEVIGRSVARLNDLLDQRSRLSSASLDGELNLSLQAPLRSRFSIKGLESLHRVLASGSEALLFNAGRHLPGPIAVVLDDGMSERQLLQRFNASLAQAGLHVEVNAQETLRFSAVDSQWQRLKDQLSIQGEDKLFAKSGFTRVETREDNLLGTPLVVPVTAEHGPLRELHETLDKGLVKIEDVLEQLNARQSQLMAQLGRHESQEEKRWAHDFTGRVFSLKGGQGSDYSRVAQVVRCQANISRPTVYGLMSGV